MVEVGDQLGGLAGPHERHNGGLPAKLERFKWYFGGRGDKMAEGWDNDQRKMWMWERKKIRVLSIFISLQYLSGWWCYSSRRGRLLWEKPS